MKVALMGIVHESNTFVEDLTELEQFKSGHWLFGEDIRKEYRSAYHEIGGMLEAMETAGIEVIPVMYAEATPAGKLSANCFNVLVENLLTELDKVLPVDGCLVVPHGAGVAEGMDDMDGHWLNLIREKLGPEVPVIGTIDPHANLSKKMIDSTTALLAYKTNPHVDQRKVGWQAGKMLVDTLMGKISPVQEYLPLPLAISIEQQYTNSNPCKEVLDFMEGFSSIEAMLSSSLVFGFPYADVAEMGSSLIVITNKDRSLAKEILGKISAFMLERITSFNGDKPDISQFIPTIDNFPKPVLLLDMGDNVGGGSPGNSSFLLSALMHSTNSNFFICLYDPAAVIQCSKASTGDIVDLTIGKDPITGKPFHAGCELIWCGPGIFEEKTPRHGGQVKFDMGPSAIVRIDNRITILLNSKRTPPFSLQQLLHFGIQPSTFDVLIAKGVNAPIAAYKDICPTILQVNTPGVTQADMTAFNFTKRRKPLFPFESIIT